MKFRVNVSWCLHGFHEIEAESAQAAVQEAIKRNLPDNGAYVKGSYVVDSLEGELPSR